MGNDMVLYIILFLVSVFLASVSQVLLKKAALNNYDEWYKQYINPWVIGGYTLFLLCTFLTMFAYRKIPLNMGPVLETTGYFYVTIFGVVFFKENFSKKKAYALALILIGILLYSI